jgi:DNA-binding MarR family transcriptional regulator
MSEIQQSDILGELGPLALGSRLKRLADALMQEGARIYEESGIRFHARWFPVYVYLYRRGPTSITGLARGLGVSHPGINKIANELIEAKLVAPYRDRNDKRKRVLALTSLGREKFSEVEPIWQDISQAMQSAVDEAGGDFLTSLSRLEHSFSRKGFHDRFCDQMAPTTNRH